MFRTRICFLVFHLFLVMFCCRMSVRAGGEESRPVRVGFFAFPGFHERNSAGENSGYGYEYLQHLAMYTGWEYEYIGYGKSWAEMQRMLDAGEIDLVGSATKTPERLERFAFSCHPMGQSYTLFTVRTGETRYLAGDYANWNGIRVGMLKGNTRNASFADFAKRKGFSFVPVYYDTPKEFQKALQEGEVDGLVSGSLRKHSGEQVYEKFDAASFYFMIRKENTALLQRLDRALAVLNRDIPELEFLLNKKYYAASGRDSIPFTVAERRFIEQSNAEKKVFHAILNPDRPPFSHVVDGKLRGIMKPLAEKIIRRTGLDIRIDEIRDRKEYYRSIAGRDSALILDAWYDFPHAEKNRFHLTRPYLSIPVSILQRKDLTGQPGSMALLRNSDLAANFMQYDRTGAHPVFYDTTAEVIDAVTSGRQDAAYLYTRTAENVILSDYKHGLTVKLLPECSTQYAVGIEYGSDPRLISILNKAVRSIPETEIAELLAATQTVTRLPFSPEEWCYANPLKTAGAGVLFFLLVIGILAAILFRRRKAWRRAKIIEQLPLRYFVFDRQEAILLSSTVNLPELNSGSGKRGFHLSDFLDTDVADLMRKSAETARISGEVQVVHFLHHGLGRTASLSRLPDSLFGRETFLWISQDTTELQTARKEAGALAERLRLTLCSIADAVMVTDARGKITLLNPVAERLTGWTQKEAVGVSNEKIFRIVNTPGGAPAESPVRSILRGGQGSGLSDHITLIARGGERYSIAESSAPVFDADGAVIGAILVFRDVTEACEIRQKLQSALRKSDELNLRLQDMLTWQNVLLESMPIYIYAVDCDNDFRYTFCNSFCADLFRLPQEEAIGKNDAELWGPEDQEMLREILRTARLVTEKEGVREDILPFPRKDGSKRIGHFFRKRVCLSGNRHWLFGMVIDITDKEKALSDTKEATEWFRLTLNSIGDGVITTDADGRIVMMNPVSERMIGVTQSEVIGQEHETVFHIVSSFDDLPMTSPVRRSLRTGSVVELANHTDLIARDGRRYHIADSAAPIRRQDGAVIGAILVFRDVSEEYAGRDKLRTALTGLEYASELSRTAYFKLSIQDKSIAESSRMYSELWPLRDGRACPPEEVVYPEDLPEFEQGLNDLLAGKLDTAVWKFRRLIGGELHDMRMMASIDEISFQQSYLVGVIQDVTELTQEKREQDDTMKLLNLILDSLPVMIFAKDAADDFRYALSNRSLEEFSGLRREEIIGHTDLEIFKNPELAAEFRRNDETVMREGTSMEFAESPLDADGNVHHLRTTKIPFLSKDGKRLLLGVIVDLTNELKPQEHLNSLLHLFEVTSQMTRSAGFRLNPATGEMSGTKLFADLWPVRDGKPLSRENVIHPDDLPGFLKICDALVSGMQKEASQEFRCIGYGDVRYYRIQMERDDKTEAPALLTGFLQDVTESHKISVLLQDTMRQDSFFHMILSLIPCQVFIKDALDDFRYKVANRNFTDYYKLPPERVIEHTDFEIFDLVVAEQLRTHDTRVCAHPGQVFHFDEDISFRRIGNEVFKSMKVCFETADHHPYLLGICVDVTEIVRSADNLQKTQTLWNLVINALPVNIFAKNADDDFRYTIANRAFADFVGRTAGDIIGKTDEELFLRPDDAERLQHHDHKVMELGTPINFTERSCDHLGTRHQMRTVKLPASAPDGSRMLLGFSLDITELDNRIRMEQLNNDILSQTVSESDFRKVIEKISDTMMKNLNCSRVIFTVCSPEHKLRLFHEAHAAELDPVPADDGGYEFFWNYHRNDLSENEIIFHEDLETIPELHEFLRSCPRFSAGSLAAAPIFIGGELAGCLMITYAGAHTFGAMDRNLLCAMSNVIALAAIRERQARSMKQSERENQALLDNISIPLWLFDVNGCIIKMNQAAVRLLDGRTLEKTPYFCRDILSCHIPENLCPVRLALADGQAHHCKSLHDGCDYLVESNPIIDDVSGEIHGVVSSFYDVTELNRVIANRQVINDCLANLVREANMHQAMELSIREICRHVGASRCYIIHFDTQNRTVSNFIEYAEDGKPPILSAFQNMPYSAKPDWEQRFRTEPLLAFPNLPENIAPEGLEAYRAFFERHQIQSLYACRIMPNRKFWGYLGLMYEKTPHRLTQSEKDFLASIANCIELMLIRQQYQNKVFNALHRAEEADRSKSIFLASMSHEIRTPLNAVIGFSELLKDGTLPKEREKEYLKAISDSGNALLALINDVLDLSKLEAGQMVFSPSEVNFCELAGEMEHIFHPKCREKKLWFRLNLPEHMPLVSVDKLRIRQILFNLIGNAVKFTDSGGITLNVSFLPGEAGHGTLEFHVADTGIGISDEDQRRLFQLFVQSKALRGTQAERNGTGLGLAICKRMIENMDGALHLNSVLGKGSDFSVILHHVPYREDDQRGKRIRPAAAESGGPVRRCTVLVADDVAMNLKVLSAMLKKLGADVLTAANADEAWDCLGKSAVDCLLTDLWMPGMNGAELAEKIRRSGKFSRLKIAAVTADTESGDNFNMSVFDAVLTKPISSEKIRSFLQSAEKSPEN